jgi:hypothetical protein
MGDVSSTEQSLNQHPTPPERKPTPDEITDRFLENRQRHQEHLTRLRTAEAEEDASELADKIEAAGEKADFDREQTTNQAQKIIKPLKPSEAPTPMIETKPPQQTTAPIITKGGFKDALNSAAWKARQTYTVISQLGGIHPVRRNGEWVMVLEPWARIEDDARQQGYSDESDYYAKMFEGVKGKIIHMKDLGGENPSVVPKGASGGIQLLDHRRIHEARRAGKAIVVNIVRPNGKPMTYN